MQSPIHPIGTAPSVASQERVESAVEPRTGMGRSLRGRCSQEVIAATGPRSAKPRASAGASTGRTGLLPERCSRRASGISVASPRSGSGTRKAAMERCQGGEACRRASALGEDQLASLEAYRRATPGRAPSRARALAVGCGACDRASSQAGACPGSPRPRAVPPDRPRPRLGDGVHARRA